MTTLGSEQVAATSRLFASSVVHELARKGRSPLFARLARQSRLGEELSEGDRVRELFDSAFRFLRREGYRHEYVYKSALTEKILLGRHSLQTASMLSEFRVGDCKADVAILNGTATVYEIKSERDSLVRLERQIRAYSQVFASVYVVSAECHLKSVTSCVPETVGILRLNNRYQISTEREAVDQPDRTSPAAIFDSIRTAEAGMILKARGMEIPDVPNTALYQVLRELFVRLEPREAHLGMVAALKKTRNRLPLAQLVEQLPVCLQTAALSIPLRKADHCRLVDAVNTRFADALEWA